MPLDMKSAGYNIQMVMAEGYSLEQLRTMETADGYLWHVKEFRTAGFQASKLTTGPTGRAIATLTP